MSEEDFRNRIDAAAVEVDSWPEWKKGVLDASFRSSNSQSRVPIANNIDRKTDTESVEKPAS